LRAATQTNSASNAAELVDGHVITGRLKQDSTFS
jgi:hypothetical protein